MRLSAVVGLIALLILPLATTQAQETERVGAPPMIWAVPHLQITSDDDTQFLRGVDTTLALPLSPRTHVTATWSLDLDDDDTATATFNYDTPMKRDTVLRGLVGVIRDRFGMGVTLHRSYKDFGVGVFGQSVDGEFEGGVMLTRQVPWGIKLARPQSLKREESAKWPSGAGDVGELGARAALAWTAGDIHELGTTTAYFPTYRHSWPREGQSVQGVSYASTEFAPPAKPAWRYQTEGPVRASAAIVDGIAYIGSYDGWLYALDVVLGRRLWRFPAEAPITGAPAWADGRLYLGTEAGDVFCVAQPRKDGPPTGQLIWRYRTSAAVTASPLVTDSGLVIVGSCDGYIYGLDRAGGRLVWKISTGGPVLASASKMSRPIPAGVDAAGTPTMRSPGVLVGSSDGKLYAIEEVKGQVIWTFTTDGPITAATAALDNRLFVANRSGSVYELDGVNGKQVWTTKVTGSVAYAPALDGKCAYVTTIEGVVSAFDAKTGHLQWQTDLKSAVAAAPTLVNGQLMYVASRDGHLWTLERPTGKVVGVQRESEPLMTCAAIADGHLLVGGDNGTVFAYVPGSGGLPLPPSEVSALPQPVVPVEPVGPLPTPVVQPTTPVTPGPTVPTPTASAPVPPSTNVPAPTPSTVPTTSAPTATVPRQTDVTATPPPTTGPSPTTSAPATLEAPKTPPATAPPTNATVAIKLPTNFPSPVTPPATNIETPTPNVVKPTTPSVAPPSVPVPPVKPPTPTPTPTLPSVTPTATRVPLLTLMLTPADGRTPVLLTNQSYLFVGGKVAPGSGIVGVRVNGLDATIKNGEYQTQVNFPGKGEYLLLVEAVDRDGGVTGYRRTIKVLEGMDATAPDTLSVRQRGGSAVLAMSAGLRVLQAAKYRKTVEVRNDQGQLVHNWTAAGDETGEISWNGANANGTALAPGNYEIIYILAAENGPIAWIRQKIEVQE
ncbi:PQQ-binding-like beta-propeller repeat protein [bacterium]|nr:PQQ-binding-like beta-propeller repeat protein [bacterium]